VGCRFPFVNICVPEAQARRSGLCFIQLASRFVTLAGASRLWKLGGRPAITDNHPLQYITNYTFAPSLTNSTQAATTLYPPATPISSSLRPTWPRSCALACPPQNPATLLPKHRTQQQAVPGNTASTRMLNLPTVTSSTAQLTSRLQLHRQWRHHARHHRRRLRHPSRRHSQHERLQHQLTLHPQTLPHRRHRKRERGCQDRPLCRRLRR